MARHKIDVDPFARDAERGEGVALRGQILALRGDPGVADLEFRHSVPYDVPLRDFNSDGSIGTDLATRSGAERGSSAVPAGVG
ncbi:MAG: hypothetical protein ACLP0J_25760 [Solirubrobacteraceae bacterium]